MGFTGLHGGGGTTGGVMVCATVGAIGSHGGDDTTLAAVTGSLKTRKLKLVVSSM